MKGTLKYYAWTQAEVTIYTLSDFPRSDDAVFDVVNSASTKTIENVIYSQQAAQITAIAIVIDNVGAYNRNSTSDVVAELYHPIVTVGEMANITRIEYTDSDKLERIIHEAEQVYIKPVIGNALYLSLITNPPQSQYDTLLDGGEFTYKGKRFQFEGLKAALAYYAYARSAKSSIIPTRYGTVEKRSEYSSQASIQERQKIIRETFEVADRYLKDCVNYIVANPDTFPGFKPGKMRSPHSLNFRIIGK